MNPFEVKTASKFNAHDAVTLYVSDQRLRRADGAENCFINGHRGTGKTMLFRIMRPDCQRIALQGAKPKYFAVFIEVLNTELSATEYDALSNHQLKHSIAESHLTLHILSNLFKEILIHLDWLSLTPAQEQQLMSRLQKSCQLPYQFASSEKPTIPLDNINACLDACAALTETQRYLTFGFIEQLLQGERLYDGPLFSLERSLLPISEWFMESLGMPVYLLIDDADDLSDLSAQILNTWIGRRFSHLVFKISTMFGYPTYKTKSGTSIQHPHDFYQYEVSTRFIRSDFEDYYQFASDVVERRLNLQDKNTNPQDLFPTDPNQDRRLEDLRQELLIEYKAKYDGRTIKDYVYRHLLSEYFKKLNAKGTLGTYRYCSFRTICDISSGQIRHLLLAVRDMYDRSTFTDQSSVIDPAIQHEVLKELSDKLLTEELPNPLVKRRQPDDSEWESVCKLINVLGNTFKMKMLSSDSERRVFSFAFQDEPSIYLKRILKLAIEEGYLITGVMSTKEGLSRRTLYVLTRRLAPSFMLDPSAYAGYLSILSSTLLEAMEKDTTIQAVRDRKTTRDDGQATLPLEVIFEEEEL